MEPSLTDPESELRRRIAALGMELQTTEAAREEAESKLLIQQKNADHARHAARNLASYGHSDGIIFVHPEDLDQGLIYRLSKGLGPTATVCRIMVRYNIDQFLQRPRLHQWLSSGKIYREAGEQQSSRFELFFDLLFIGMVHQISEAAAEQPTGIGFAKYILTFVPAFSIWGDVRDIANQFANDDVTQRAYILWIMVLLVGYSNNASAIEYGKPETGLESGVLTEDSLTSMRWTLGFFVVAKLSKVALSLIYSLFLPLSRAPLILSTLNAIPTTILFLVAMFTPLHVTIALVSIGIALDYFLRVIGVLLFKTMEGLGKKYERRRRQHEKRNSCPWKLEDDINTPDVEKPTADEQGAFEDRTVTVNSSMTALNEEAPLGAIKELGEMVVSVFFTSSGRVGLNMESGRAILGLMIAFNLNWMYFGSQACKHFIHAIRRHWMTGFLFTNLHLPLCMSLLLASSAINRLVLSASLESELGGGLRWFFGAGLGVSVCTMATIGVLHKNLDDQAGLTERATIRRTISRRFVLGIRYLAGVAMILIPIAEDLSSIQFLAIYVGITAFLIVEEIIARIEKREQDLDTSSSADNENVV